MVVHEHPAAVVGQVAVGAVDDHVAGRVAARKQVLRGYAGHGLHDDLARQPDDFAAAVDGAAVALEDVERPGRREADAGVFEDREGGFVDGLDVAARQHVPVEPGGDGIDPRSHQHRPRRLTVDKGGVGKRRPSGRGRRRPETDGAPYRPQERLIVPMLMEGTASTVSV
jgi:hypothetical protein